MRVRSYPDHASAPRIRRVAAAAFTTAVALGVSALVAPAAHAADTQIQILATNDFHGRILDEGAQAGAAKLAADDTSLAAERLRGIVLSHRDWVLGNGARVRLRAQWRELFKSFDAVICPVLPTPALPHDHSLPQEARRLDIDGRNHDYRDQIAWPGFATLPGLPATAIPIGLSPEGLPVGVQIVGPMLEDRTTLKLAELIEREFGGFVRPPMFDD